MIVTVMDGHGETMSTRRIRQFFQQIQLQEDINASIASASLEKGGML